MKLKLVLSSICSGILLTAHCLAAPSDWSISGRIHIGGDGGWDYLVTQPGTNRLFVSHAQQVVVVDMKAQAIIGSIPANGVHGIALAADLNRGFISNGTDGTVTIFDLTKLKILATLPAEKNPDAICYEPTTHRVLAFNGKSGTATVIDAVEEKVIGEISLAGKPEFAVTDGRGHVFDALEDKSQILKINADTSAIEARWNLPGDSNPSGLAIDVAHGRLFIGCRNKSMVVLDAASGKVISTLPIGEGVDACVYDPKGKRAFASCGDGTMTVIQQSDSDTYTVTEKAITEPRARTMAFDPTTGTAYLPIAQFAPAPLPTPDRPTPRPSVLPDTLEILIVSERP
jgi:DNA-binding beta-propeller fold protein YncE